MKCNYVQDNIDAYIDGELGDDTQAFKAHLETCEACQKIYDETMEIKALLSDLEPLELPDDFESSLHDKLMATKVLPFYKQPLVKGIGYVSSIAAVGVIAFLSGFNMTDGNQVDLVANDYGDAGLMEVKREMLPEDDMMPESAVMDSKDYDDEAEDFYEAGITSDVNEEDGVDITTTFMNGEMPPMVAISLSPEDLKDGLDIYYYQISNQVSQNDIKDLISRFSVSKFSLRPMGYSFIIDEDLYMDFREELAARVEYYLDTLIHVDGGSREPLYKIIIEMKEE